MASDPAQQARCDSTLVSTGGMDEVSINYQRRDFLRRSLYCGLALGLPGPVLAVVDDEQELLREMEHWWQLIARDFQSPDVIICGENVYRAYREELGYIGLVKVDD